MKNIKIFWGSFIIILTILLVVLGCQNSFELAQAKSFPGGKGGFLLKINNSGSQRTIMPEDIKDLALGDFTSYKLDFYVSGTTTNPETFSDLTYSELSDPIELDAGTWDLYVSAYVEDNLEPVAQGRLFGIEIVEGRTVGGLVTLTPVSLSVGTGTFSWDIEYPATVYAASMKITPLDADGTPEDTYNLIGGESPLGVTASLSLVTGYYRVVFINGGVEAWNEILQIYDDMVSEFTFTFVTYTVTFDTNGGTTIIPTQTVRKGETAIIPLKKPFKANYSFNNWYSDYAMTTVHNFSTPVTANTIIYAKWDVPGIYMGIIKFANTAVDITNNAPILIDASGKNTLNNKLTSDYVIAGSSGTTMSYGVHKALANLKINEANFPANLDSVHIITFTDGLDLSSAGLSQMTPIENEEFENEDQYIEYVNSEINNRKINGIPIKAYSIGVRGSDLNVNIPEIMNMFYRYLEGIASPNESYVLDNFSGVQLVFNDIANGLNTENTSTNFIIKAALLSNNTKIRMTFDINSELGDPTASQRFIDATVKVENGIRTLTDISYSPGISSDEGTGPIFGAIVGADNTDVIYVFNNIKGYSKSTDETNTRQWRMPPNITSWVHNEEYKPDGSSETTVEKSSILIYLVLDNSTSMGADDILVIRNTAQEFISNLYDKYNQ
jgi:hypothetical protein